MDVSRWAVDLELSAAYRARLERLIRDGNTPLKLVPRSRVALLSDGTRLNGTIAMGEGQMPIASKGYVTELSDLTYPHAISTITLVCASRVPRGNGYKM